MYPGSEADLFDFFGRQVESARDHPRIVGGLFAMSGGIVLPEFGGARQGLDRLFHRFLIRILRASAQFTQSLDQLFEVFRPVVFALKESFDISRYLLPLRSGIFSENVHGGDLITARV